MLEAAILISYVVWYAGIFIYYMAARSPNLGGMLAAGFVGAAPLALYFCAAIALFCYTMKLARSFVQRKRSGGRPPAIENPYDAVARAREQGRNDALACQIDRRQKSSFKR